MDRQHRDFSGLRRHAKVHSFRIITAVLVWVFIGLRFTTGPTGSNGVSELRRMAIEIVLRELGGFIWIQITVLIIFIRVVFSTIATGWRYRRE